MRVCLTSPSSPRRQRGVSLLESIVAFVLLAAGTAAVGALQSHLRLAGDVARERSEAVRIGSAAIEELRSFSALDGAGDRTYAGIASGDAAIEAASGPSTHDAYRVERRIDAAGFGATKATSLAVRWSDRSGSAREVVLHSFIAAVAPAYAGSLGLAIGVIDGTPRGASDRSPALPLTARNLGDGRSAWKPSERGATALLFDNRSGAVVGRCDGIAATTASRDLSVAALARCESGRWLLVAGTIRFTSTLPANPLAANEPPPSTAVAIALRDGRYPAPASCFSEARKTVRYLADGSLHLDDVAVDATAESAGLAAWDDTGDRFLAWHCVVAPRADGRWSGRVEVVAGGWTIGITGASRRVCRYLGAAGDLANDANIAAAGDDTNVGAALVGRNFLVVRGSESCPGEPRTEQHQP